MKLFFKKQTMQQKIGRSFNNRPLETACMVANLAQAAIMLVSFTTEKVVELQQSIAKGAAEKARAKATAATATV